MKENVIKKSVVCALLLSLLGGLVTGTILIKNSYKNEELDLVNDPVLDTIVPVIKEETKEIIRPYIDNNIQVLKSYYDYKSDAESQLNAIIFYNNTYLQNTGILYGSDDVFDVVAIADGEIIKIEDSEIAGKTVEIKHNDNVISVYQILDDVRLTINTNIKKGDKIGISSTSNLDDNTKKQLYFELIVNGELVDGEKYYGKNINEI